MSGTSADGINVALVRIGEPAESGSRDGSFARVMTVQSSVFAQETPSIVRQDSASVQARPVRINQITSTQRGKPIAALLLKLTWRRYLAGDMTVEALQTTAFSLFLYARMLGCAAEIDDHLNRGRDMDTRTPASRCEFVA